MADTVQNRRGAKESLPVLLDGELGLCSDTKEVFIGNSGENVPLLTLTKAAGKALGIDTEPTAGSDNLVTSGAVNARIESELGNIAALLESI